MKKDSHKEICNISKAVTKSRKIEKIEGHVCIYICIYASDSHKKRSLCVKPFRVSRDSEIPISRVKHSEWPSPLPRKGFSQETQRETMQEISGASKCQMNLLEVRWESTSVNYPTFHLHPPSLHYTRQARMTSSDVWCETIIILSKQCICTYTSNMYGPIYFASFCEQKAKKKNDPGRQQIKD